MSHSTSQSGLQGALQPTHLLSPAEQALQERLAFLVGCCAIALPLILWLFGTFAPNVCMRDSISHFFYAPFLGSVFVGILFFIGGFMLALTGENPIEKYFSAFAGIGAAVLAVFPTSGDGCEQFESFAARPFAHMTRTTVATENQPATYTAEPHLGGAYFNVFEKAESLHMWGAGIVFFFLGIYCIFVLTRVVDTRHRNADGTLKTTKSNRNKLYRICGVTIIACVAALGLKGQVLSDLTTWNRWNLTFYVEAIALVAFAIAWFAKGRRFTQLNENAPVPLAQL